MSRIARASLIIAFFFGIDKILGLLRQVMFNRTFGPFERDIFFVSNNIPDLLSALISGGALGVALIPVLTETLQEQDRRAAWALFSRILNLAFVATAAVSLVIFVFADPLIRYVIAPGFNDPQKWALTASLMRLDLAAILIFSLSGLVMAGLQANQHFLTPAMAPVAYNLGQILGIVVLAPFFGIYGLVYGVILGALMHLGVQLPALFHFGFRWSPGLHLNDTGVHKVLRLMGPRVLAMLLLQIYFLARDRIASYFVTGAISALNNGWFIMQLPETLIGTAIAIALLPSLSEYFNRGERQRFKQTVNNALRTMLAFGLPAAALLAVGVRPLVEAVFHFGPVELEMVVWATRAFLLGLVGHTWLEVAVRSWYANQEARLPLLGAILQIVLYIPLALLLSSRLGPAGIALADTLAFTSQALLLLILLDRRYPGVLAVGRPLLRVGLASAGGALVAGLVMQLSYSPILLALAGMALGGIVVLPFIWPEMRLLVHLGE